MTEPAKCNCSPEATWQRVNDYADRCSCCGKCVGSPLARGHSSACAAYRDLYTSGANADVTFVLTDGEIRAHKLILTTRVAYFEELFSSDTKECVTNRFLIPDFDRKSFDVFLQFIYGGQLPNDFEAEVQLTLAEKYDVPGLVPHCIPKLKDNFVEMSGADSIICITAAKLISFGNCIAEAARIMRAFRFPEVKIMLELELLAQIRKISPLFSAPHEDELKKLFVVSVVDLLVLSHLEKSASLKSECLKQLKSFDKTNRLPPEMLTDAWKKLKEYPDLLLDAVMRFPSGRF